MDFQSLGENSIVHVVTKRPFRYMTGTIKSKTARQQNVYLPTQQQGVDITVTVGGNDLVLPNVLQGLECVEFNNCFYSTTKEGAKQAIANLMQMAANGKAEMSYFDSILNDGEKYMEQLDPAYAEGKRQAAQIRDLQTRADKQDEKLDEILKYIRAQAGPAKK